MSLLDFAYLGALACASPWLLYKAITRPRHVAGLRDRLTGSPEVRGGTRPCVWVHGVSVGEVVASEPLVRALEQALPGVEVAISTSTATGQAVARRKFPDRRVFYFPIDFSWSVRRVFESLRPSLVVLVELELWPNFLTEARARNVPVVVVNGRISERSFRGYRLARRFLPLKHVARYCVQTEQYAARFRKLGVEDERIVVTGSMKYDGVATVATVASGTAAAAGSAAAAGAAGSRSASAEARASLGLGAEEAVWIAGSTHFPEERQLLEVFARVRASRPELRLVLAPRHNERADEVRRAVEAAGLTPVLRSTQLGARGAAAPAPQAQVSSSGHVVIVDTLGELSRLYAAADLVFVGGSLIPHGGQNILEPAALGKPVIFGPHVQNFQESVERLLAADGAVQVADAAALEVQLRQLLADPARARALGARGLAAIEAAKGATARTVVAIEQLARPLLRERLTQHQLDQAGRLAERTPHAPGHLGGTMSAPTGSRGEQAVTEASGSGPALRGATGGGSSLSYAPVNPGG